MEELDFCVGNYDQAGTVFWFSEITTRQKLKKLKVVQLQRMAVMSDMHISPNVILSNKIFSRFFCCFLRPFVQRKRSGPYEVANLRGL